MNLGPPFIVHDSSFLPAPWSNGDDARITPVRRGFDSLRGYFKSRSYWNRDPETTHSTPEWSGSPRSFGIGNHPDAFPAACVGLPYLSFGGWGWPVRIDRAWAGSGLNTPNRTRPGFTPSTAYVPSG